MSCFVRPISSLCLYCSKKWCRGKDGSVDWWLHCFEPKDPFSIYFEVSFLDGCFYYLGLVPYLGRLDKGNRERIRSMCGFSSIKEFHKFVLPYLDEWADGSKRRVFEILR